VGLVKKKTKALVIEAILASPLCLFEAVVTTAESCQ